MISNKIQLFKSSSSKKEVLEYNGISLDTYCTYCQISESLFEDNFSVEIDLRFPEDESLIDVVENEKEYAITQTQKTKPFLFKTFNDFTTAIPLEENIRLEIISKEDEKSTVIFEGENYYVDNNCLVRNEIINNIEYAYTQIKIWQCLAYEEPDYSSQLITIIPPGKTVRILAKYDWFVKIEYNNQIMYVEGDKLNDYFSKSEYDTVEIKDIINNVKDLLVNGSILKVMDEYNVYEIFRITNITTNNNYTSIYARQITLEDSLRLWINDSRPTNLTGQSSLEKLYTDSVGRVKELTTFSNISVNNTVYIVRKNLNEALTDGDNSFLSRWGGEIERRGYKLSILNKRGNDNNVTFRRGKNYTGIEEDVNQDKLVTRIIPIAFDGITLPEIYVDSPKINNYYNIFPQEIKFEEVKYKDSPNNSNKEGFDTLEEVYAELRKQASEYFTNNKCDELKGTYNIKVVDITSTEEYKDVSIFEKTWIGDTVTIIDEKLNINLKARVSSRKYDVIQNKRIETEVTNISKKMETLTLEYLKDKIDNIQVPDMPNIQDIINQAKLEAETMIRNGITNSYVVLKDNEILIMDNPDVNQAVNLLRMNKNGIAGSTTGYNGSFNLAMTIDGQIVADRITSGIMNAGVIRAGVLMSANAKTWINMENGTFNFSDKIKFDGNEFNVSFSDVQELNETFEGINSNISGLNTSLSVLQGEITTKITSEQAESIAQQKVDGFKQEVSNTYISKENAGDSFLSKDQASSLTAGLQKNLIIGGNFKLQAFDSWDNSRKHNIKFYTTTTGLTGITVRDWNYEGWIYSNHVNVKAMASNKISFTVKMKVESNLRGAEVFLGHYGANKNLIREVWIGDASAGFEGEIVREGYTIPSDVHYVALRIDHNGLKKNTDSSVVLFLEYINLVEGDTVPHTFLQDDGISLKESYSKIEQTAEGIKQTVSKKVDSDEIISTINQTAEVVQIQASRINLDGYVFVSSQLKAPHITGGALVYIEEDGILSCDGETYATKLNITNLARDCYFSSDAPAYFNNTLLAKKGLTANDRIHAKKGISVDNGITANGNMVLNGYTVIKNNSLGVESNIYCTNGTVEAKYLKVNNSGTVSGTLEVTSTLYAASLEVLKYGTVLKNLTVNEGATLRGYVSAKNSVGIDQNLYVGGNIEALDYGYGQINCRYLGSHGNIVALGNLSVSGSKNCVQETENFGKRLINAYETCDYYFGDIGESQTINGEMIIWIDDIFKEIISTEVDYQVFITKYGRGDIWVEERAQDYFVVKSENDISFGWEIKGKRKGYEKYRLEEFKEDK